MGQSTRAIMLQMFNTGTSDLHVLAINVTNAPDIAVDPPPTYPIVIAPAGEADVTLKYQPKSPGTSQATVEVVSDDPSGSRIIQVNGAAVAS